MTSFQTIILQKQNAVGTITLNRPDRLNALNEQMIKELALAEEEVAKDEEIRVLVITGAGKAFCAGGDFKYRDVRTGAVAAEEAEPASYDYILHGNPFRGMQGVILGLQRLGIPTIAMVNGPAIGGAFDLALACDMRIGSDKARFMVGFTRIGLNPGATGGTWMLPRLIGTGRALELLFSGDYLEAEEAYRIGLLNKLVPADELEKETMAWADRLAQGPPISYRVAKMQLYKGFDIDLEAALALGVTSQYLCILSEDHKEGVRAFAEKRRPQFKGK